MDFAGLFYGGMFLIVVDTNSKWMGVVQMSSTSVSATIRAFRGLFATHGLPEEIVADNGPQFVAAEMKDFLNERFFNCQWCSPVFVFTYHPAFNGEAEHTVRTFKEAMRVMKNKPGTQTEKLARFLLRYRDTLHTATGCLPAEILMGRRLRTRLELLRPDFSARIEQKSRRMNSMVRRGFEVGDPVMVDQLRELADSKVADVEPKSYELPEVDLPETLDASVRVRKTLDLNNSLYRMRSLQHPLLKFHHLDRLFHKKLRILLSQPFLKNLDVVQLEFDRNLNV